jgi:hypothetical protein
VGRRADVREGRRVSVCNRNATKYVMRLYMSSVSISAQNSTLMHTYNTPVCSEESERSSKRLKSSQPEVSQVPPRQRRRKRRRKLDESSQEVQSRKATQVRVCMTLRRAFMRHTSLRNHRGKHDVSCYTRCGTAWQRVFVFILTSSEV